MAAATVYLAAAVWPTGRLHAQVRIDGIVVDSSGTPIPLVEVTAADTRVLTGRQGRFSLAGIRSPDSVVVHFRRVGFRPVDRAVVTAARGSTIDLGSVTLDPIPIRLEDIHVEALLPIMPARGIRAYEFARREGVSRQFFTAYDIERLRPFDILDLTRRVAGARTGEDPVFGRTIQFRSRGGSWCTATIVLDGVRTANPDPTLTVPPERVGAMWYTPRDCTVHIWTKPVPIERTSTFEIGARIAASSYGTGFGTGTVGGYLAMPVIPDRLFLYPAFDAATARTDLRWRAQFALRLRAAGREPEFFVGGGAVFRRFAGDPTAHPTTVPTLSAGLSRAVGPLRMLGELVLSAPWQGAERRLEVVVGVGYRN